MGYSWRVWFRLTPGGTKDLRTLMSWAGGPTNVEVNYVPIMERRETVTRNVNVINFGFRVQVGLRFAVGGNMADHTAIRDIVNGLVDPAVKVELSLDNQTTYREVEMRRYDGPDPFDGKTIAGAWYRIEVETTAPIATIPAVGSGSW